MIKSALKYALSLLTQQNQKANQSHRQEKKKGRKTEFLKQDDFIFNWVEEPIGNIIARVLIEDGNIYRIQVIDEFQDDSYMLALFPIFGFDLSLIEWVAKLPKDDFWG